jgi:UDP-2,4-diacetamido-2,4,6-trideoxy-beta-L-altropyranose hydrolase
MTSQVLVIRADSTIDMGTGHIMRCLALAQVFHDAGGAIVFAMAESTPAAIERVYAEGMRVVPLTAVPGSSNDAKELAEVAHREHADWVVVDGYQFGAEYQRSLKHAGLKVLFLDDYGHAEHYYADIVLNPEGRDGNKLYESREPGTRLLMGHRYALLRREFTAWRLWQREIAPIARKILITLGGSDPTNVTPMVMQSLGLLDTDDVEATVVVGGSNPHMDSVQKASAWFPGTLRIVRSVSDMAKLMSWADLAVSAAGTTCWELFMMGLPAIIIPVAENQRPASGSFHEIGAAKEMDGAGPVFAEKLGLAVSELLRSQDERARMSRTARKLVDGLGAIRILQSIGYGVKLDLNATVSIVPVMLADRKEFLRMAEQHFRDLNPNFVPHEDWKESYFEHIVGNPDLFLRWITVGPERVGFMLFGFHDHRFLPRKNGAIYEVYVVPTHRRHGIASVCAKWAIQELSAFAPAKIELEVMINNMGALALWESIGFRKVSDRFVLNTN